MRVARLSSSILIVILVSMVLMPVGTSTVAEICPPEFSFSASEEITGVPYVWQQVNGFCFPAALSMVLQSRGLNLGLHDILTASGAGFSMVSISVDEAMMFLPGVMVRQMPWFEFFTDLYGLDMQFYLDSSTEYGHNALQILGAWGSNAIDYSSSQSITPLDVMRESIDAGYPLAISADTYYLPPVDWDIIRDHVGPMQPGGVGHAIVIVGYNDTSQTVRLYDPGVGLMEPYVGYPDDGRWNYTMSYSELDDAWQSAGYATFKVSNGTGRVADFEDRLAAYISHRMIGNRSAYFQGYENYFYLGTGADAFRGMGLDMTLEAIRDYCYHYREVDKPEAIRSLGHNLELMMTMQYHAYRSALDSLPDLLPSIDLEVFLDTASQALPHMEALSHNSSITSGVDITNRDTILYNTFFGMAESFESSHDLDNAINKFTEELGEIAGHFFAIAEAWRTAGEILYDELGLETEMPIESLLLIVGGGTGAFAVGAVLVIWRKRR
ncbi:MAG: C39 family peptidase [Candidatus Thorarchaeota archaeon]|nr:MAG: C39 family peptidase [Candidatus Thorarchaeota archaeon]